MRPAPVAIFITVIFLSLASTPAAAGWDLRTEIDDFTGEEILRGVSCNEQGFCLEVYTFDREVWGRLILPSNEKNNVPIDWV